MPSDAASDARARSEVPCVAAQNFWSKSTPATCAHPWTQRRAFLEPSRFTLYTQIRRTRLRPGGSQDLSMTDQLPLF
eukprot:5657676-Pleurochrysis_carterae.AAC.1